MVAITGLWVPARFNLLYCIVLKYTLICMFFISPVEVCTNAVENLGTELILLPLLGVELQHGLVHQVGPLLQAFRFITRFNHTFNNVHCTSS